MLSCWVLGIGAQHAVEATSFNDDYRMTFYVGVVVAVGKAHCQRARLFARIGLSM